MARGLSKSIQIGIIGIWLCLVGILVYRHYISGETISSLQAVHESQFTEQEEWFGIYVQNTKIGHVRTATEKIGDEYRFTQQGETEAPGEGGTTKSTTLFTCLTDRSFRMKSFSFETRTGETFYRSRGEIDEDGVLLVFIENNQQKKTETVDMGAPPYLPITIKSLLYSQGLEKGKRFRVPVFDIFSGKTEEMTAEVQDLLPVKAGINVMTVYVLKTGGTLSWINDRGYTMKETNPAGFQYIVEPENLAVSTESKPIVDLFSLPVLKADRLLRDTETLSLLRVKLTGSDEKDYPLLNEGRQHFEGGVLEIRKEREEDLEGRTYDLPYSGNNLASYRGAGPYVESDHRTIKYNANKFVAIEKNAFRLARFLTSNLYLTIRKMPMLHLLTSMDVFGISAGDSNEHTILFTAFARAAGLPTRMVGGLVYLKGHFYYHTWPEVWLDEWVPIDPTMGQFPADVTHIRFLEGHMEELASFTQNMGAMHIEILEAL